MLKVWNISLVLATGTLAIMGTFLVRSGVLNSIHAFGGATLGVPFVVLIAVLIAGSIYLVASRREMLRSEHRLDSLLSREAAFLANNLVLVALCFVIFWGTYFPLISQALTGTEASVGPPWFDRYTVPLALVLVLLSGIGPAIAWRRATLANARRNFVVPVAVALLTLIVLLGAGVVGKHRAGVLPRDARPRGDGRRGASGRARGARAAQPQALRRLHRAHRDRRPVRGGRRLVLVPARLRAGPLARPVRARGRLHRPLRAPDGERDPRLRLGEHPGRPRTECGHTLSAGRDPGP
jgi:cytochrome c-type biogenesis protein CcmF